MAKNLWLIDNFSGGIADEDKRGIAGSFRWGEQLDYRSNPSYITGVNIPTKQTASVLADYPTWIKYFGSNVFAYGHDNHIYKSGSPWTDAHTNGQTGAGNGMEVMGTVLYYASNAKLGSYDGAATWTDDLKTFKSGTAGEWHPMKIYSPAGGLCVGDGRYIAVLDYDGTTWADGFTPTVDGGLTLPAGERVKCLEVWNDYLVIGCWQGTNIYDKNYSNIYLWDGTSTTYNAKITLYESGINGMINSAFGLVISAGIKGNLYQYNGGAMTLLKQIPYVTLTGGLYNEVFPGAMTNFRGVPHIGFAGAGTDTVSYKGVYSWGSINKNYPATLNYDYKISTGTKQGTGCLVTALEATSDTSLYIGWKDGATYGIDLVGTTNKVTSAVYESLWFDARVPFQEKNFKEFFLTYEDLAANETITVKYRKDTQTSWTTLGATEADGENFQKFLLGIKCRKIQIQITLAGTTTLPKLRSIGAFYETIDL